jgi:hypothetical protein
MLAAARAVLPASAPVVLLVLQAIVLQGIVGCFPWQAMVFFTLWLQLNGFSNATSSMLVATFGAGVAMVSTQHYKPLHMHAHQSAMLLGWLINCFSPYCTLWLP